MSQFFKALGLFLADKQEFKLTARKVGEDLVLLVQPDVKGTGKVVNITVPALDLEQESLDSQIIGEFSKAQKVEQAKYQANATDAPEKDEEEDDDNSADTNKASTTDSRKSRAGSSKKNATNKKGGNKNQPGKQKKQPASVKTQPEIKPRELKEGEILQEGNLPEGTNLGKSEPISSENITGAEQTIQEKFDALMLEGKGYEEKYKYKAALTRYANAANLVPENEESKAAVNRMTEKLDQRESKSTTKGEEQQSPAAEVTQEGPDNKELFDYFMDEGKKAMDNRQWVEAEKNYKAAVNLFQEDAKAKEGLRQSSLWVKRISETITSNS